MRLLVIGGTSFIGRHIVEQAVTGEHDVAVFHRGQTNRDLLAGSIDHRFGDRAAGDYASLATADVWDAVIDVSSYVPRNVEQLADTIEGRLGHYVHVSSISVYDEARIDPTEDSPLYDDLVEPTEEITPETYGPLKAMGERAALTRFGASAVAIVRPTYVCGPYDSSGRFGYWVRRMESGGAVAVARTDDFVQIVDVRDLAAFILHCATERVAGTFDGVGPFHPVEEFLAAIAPAGRGYELIEVGYEPLAAAGIVLPIVPPGDEPAELFTRPGARARAAGLTTRTVAETAEATRAWDDADGRQPLDAGPSAEQEAALIKAVR